MCAFDAMMDLKYTPAARFAPAGGHIARLLLAPSHLGGTVMQTPVRQAARRDIWLAIEIRQTKTFAAWFRNLRDRRARARIQMRIDRLSLGNPGDLFRPPWSTVIVLLAGGDKRTQTLDIEAALRLARFP